MEESLHTTSLWGSTLFGWCGLCCEVLSCWVGKNKKKPGFISGYGDHPTSKVFRHSWFKVSFFYPFCIRYPMYPCCQPLNRLNFRRRLFASLDFWSWQWIFWVKIFSRLDGMDFSKQAPHLFLWAGAVMAKGKEHECEGTKNKLYKSKTCKGDEFEYSYDFCMFLFHCDLILWEV